VSVTRLTHVMPVKDRLGLPGIFGFACGVILLYRLAYLPPSMWLLVAFPGFLVPALLARQPMVRKLFIFLACFALGTAWAGWHAENRLSERLPSGLEGERIRVSGYLCDLPQPGSFNSLRFGFCVTRWHLPPDRYSESALPSRLRLSWYGYDGQPLPDHRMALDIVPKRPHGNLNEAGFRYEDWLFRQGYRATGSIRQVAADLAVSCGLRCHYHQWHLKVARAMKVTFGGSREYGLIASLLMGNRGYLSDQQWQTLKATGTVHLVAISGLHLGLVAIGAGFIARRLLLLWPQCRGQERSRRFMAFLVIVISCTGYALLAGFTVPTRRALIMVLIGGWSLLLGKETSHWKPFLLALMIALLMDSFAPLDQGFWLSFGAVGVLLLVFANRVAGTGWLQGLLAAQVAVFVGLWPILLWLGQQQPVSGLLANVLAIPWVSLVVMPMLFFGVLVVLVSGGALPTALVDPFDLVLGILMVSLEWVSNLPAPSLPEPGLPVLIALAMMVFLVMRSPDLHLRFAALVAAVFWLAGAGAEKNMTDNLPTAEPAIRILDVGQGLSVLVQDGHRVMLYDTGPEVKGVFSAVESSVLPVFRKIALKRIDHLVVSHGDGDHAGGLDSLMAALTVEAISSGEPGRVSERMASPAPVQVLGCSPRVIRWPQLAFHFWQSAGGKSGNDASCVVRVYHQASDTDILLTGDISAEVEREMLTDGAAQWLRDSVAHRYIIAPHHGSHTSSSREWLAAVGSGTVIYTAGYRHRYGHPHVKVASRYREAGFEALSTACSGQLTIRLKPETTELEESWRSMPFWISGRGLTRDQCTIP